MAKNRYDVTRQVAEYGHYKLRTQEELIMLAD